MTQNPFVLMLMFKNFICSKNARFSIYNFALLPVRKNLVSMRFNRTFDWDIQMHSY